MKSDEFLFRLVKSLDKAEKRFFRLSSNLQSGEKKYLIVFDALESMGEYDRDSMLEVLSKNGIEQDLPGVKKHLYDLILRSLRHFNEKKTIDTKLKNLIIEAGILEDKTLFQPALKHLRNAKRLAVKHNRHLIILEILSKEIDLIIQVQKVNLEETYEELYEMVKTTTQVVNLEIDYGELYHRIFLCTRIGDNENRVEILKSIEQHELFKKEPIEASFDTEYFYLYTCAYYYYLNKKITLSKKYHKKVLDLWEEYPILKKENLYKYKKSLSNYLSISHADQDYSDFQMYLEKSKKIPSKTLDQKAESFQIDNFLELLFYMNTGKFAKAVKLVSRIEEGLEQYRLKINHARWIGFHYNIFILFFALAKYHDAQTWLTRILNEPRVVKSRQDLRRASKIFEIIIHIELGNDLVLDDYILPAIKRKIKQYHPIQVICIKGLERIAKWKVKRGKSKSNDPYSELKRDLQAVVSDERIFGMKEVMIWLIES